MDELLRIEAHDSEILCLAFSPTETGKALFFKFTTEFNRGPSCSRLSIVSRRKGNINLTKLICVLKEMLGLVTKTFKVCG